MRVIRRRPRATSAGALILDVSGVLALGAGILMTVFAGSSSGAIGGIGMMLLAALYFLMARRVRRGSPTWSRIAIGTLAIVLARSIALGALHSFRIFDGVLLPLLGIACLIAPSAQAYISRHGMTDRLPRR